MTRMHADEAETDAALVTRLLAAQHPRWARLPVEPVAEAGTDYALYRLGRDLAVRLPRLPRVVSQLEKELRWLPALAPALPLPIPEPVATGEPAEGFPFPWAVFRWLEGEAATVEPLADLGGVAAALAAFVRALQAIDAADGPKPGAHNAWRGVPLARRDEAARAALAKLEGVVDVAAATEAWEAALAAPDWAGPPVWIHGDLDARNVLVRDGRLAAVLDFGCLGVGDPACDVMVAWKLLDGDARAGFRAALAVDDATWARAHGWVVSQAVIALGYYTDATNPILVTQARRWLAAALEDEGSK